MEKQTQARQPEAQGEAQTSPRRHQFESQEGRAFWMRCIGSARIMWGCLTYEELRKTGGEPRRLVALVEKRYAISRGEATRQVEGFLSQCGTWS